MKRSLAVATSNRSRLVVEIEHQDGRLSISGTCTDTAGGYSGGQIGDHVIEDAGRIAGEPGGMQYLGAEELARLVVIWQRWHLNDMRAGCEHQTGPEWDTEKYGSAWRREEVPAEIIAELEHIGATVPPPPSPSANLERLGFALTCSEVTTRPGVKAWAAGSRHYRCTLTREGRAFSFFFSQGSAIKEAPDLAGVFDCLRSDASLAADESEAEACGVKLSEWAELQRQAEQFRAVVGEHAEALGVAS